MCVYPLGCVFACQGVIREVAEQRVGGAERLSAAIKRGAVKVSLGENNVEFYHFPSMSHGTKESLRSVQEMSRTKETTKGAFSAVASLADSLKWAIVGPTEAPHSMTSIRHTSILAMHALFHPLLIKSIFLLVIVSHFNMCFPSFSVFIVSV